MSIFVAVAELQGFAPAARKLKISPSAVTRLVAALEERLGTRLLQRTTRSVSLTDAGARYLERARKILADIHDAEQAAQRETSVPTGRLVVDAPQVFGRTHIAPIMCDFLAKHPKVSGQLTLSDRMMNLVEDGIDVAIRIGELEDSTLIAKAIGVTRRVIVASPKYLTAKSTPKTPADLRKHNIIQFTSLDVAPEWRFTLDGKEQRVAFVPKYVTNSADAAIGHAEKSRGLTMALSYQVIDSVREGRLRVVLSNFEPNPLPIHLVYPSTRLLSAKVRRFVDMVSAARDWTFMDL